MTDRTRFALLVLVVVTCVTARAGGALGATDTPVTAVHSTASTAQKQARVVGFARRYLGVPYSYGGASPASGFDCSGFTLFVYAHFGITLPHYSGAQFGMGRPVSRSALAPGDLVFFNGLGHVGIYIGGGRLIHAVKRGTTVSIDPMSGWYSARYEGARRVL